MSDLNKHQLEDLRKQILKELKTRYPKKKIDYGIPPEERTPTDLELNLIIGYVEHPSHKLFMESLAYSGCRPCELINSKIEDWDLKESCVYVWIAKKEHKIRLPKYIPDILAMKIKLWFRTRAKDIKKSGGYVFFNRFRKGPIILKAVNLSFRRACDNALGLKFYTIANDKNNPKIKGERKLRNYTLKSLRKYFVSKIYDFSQDGLMSSRLLHHSNINTSSEYYIALNKDKKKKVIKEAFKK